MNECEESSRKIQKISSLSNPKSASKFTNFFSKRERSHFCKTLHSTLAHALARTRTRASSEEEEGEEGVVVVFGHFLVAQIKFIA